MHLRPLNDNILVVPLEARGKTDGGLFIPPNAKTTPNRGKVVAVGAGRRMDDGDQIPIQLKVGDEVLFSKFAGTDIELHGENHKMLKEADILGVVLNDG